MAASFQLAGLTHLRGLEGLRALYLRGTKVTDRGLKELGKLPGLLVLHVGDTKVTDKGVAELQKALPRCKVFR